MNRGFNSDCAWSSQAVKHADTRNLTSYRRLIWPIILVALAVILSGLAKVDAQSITLTPVEDDEKADVCREFRIAQATFEAILEAEGTPIEATIRAGDARARLATAVRKSISDDDVSDAIDAIDVAYDALTNVYGLVEGKLLGKFNQETFVSERAFYPPSTRVYDAISAITDAYYETLEAACHLGVVENDQKMEK